MFMILGCVIYPNNWDNPKIVDICETSSSYYPGKCQIRWAYILAIIGIFDILCLAILALVLSRRQTNNYKIASSLHYNDSLNRADLTNNNNTLNTNTTKIDSNSFRDFRI